MPRNATTSTSIFSPDHPTARTPIIIPGQPIADPAGIISDEASAEALTKGKAFAQEIEDRFISDFEKTEALHQAGKVTERDLMVHVSTFVFTQDTLYVTYYANTKEHKEDPDSQTARLVYCPIADPTNKVFLDMQSVGDDCYGNVVEKLYDTILMQKDDDTLYVLWTAQIGGNYYRLYRSFTISTQALGPVQVNRFQVGDIVNDFSTTGMQAALTENGVGYKHMYIDIGIMQKLSTRRENGKLYYYSGAYTGDFTCIIKSRDLVTWEYVSQPSFLTQSKWENAVYVIGDVCYYFVRQQESHYGFLTAYDLVRDRWATPVLIADCQSRSDFIVYQDQLYLFHAPKDREHIGIIRVDTENLANSSVVLQAKMQSSCFYPFVQYGPGHELFMSYTVARQHIRLAGFTLSKYL
ncbi:MAG: hypothetical protein BGO82_14135 [Devosia sp. 67-54]|uniref:hypothetical protein n=1 Tax=unclassified Devosia TaxID=196773 RepID=UPI00095ADE8C|nr:MULTISPECIES: hypothetical protein [unclassified Devosia]MBN9306761.1 hypothetical protein [Devosia sp.]OJX16017.1 MAG: hypothetical protein BGO82_14135 [Devosia sp. 67-54]